MSFVYLESKLPQDSYFWRIFLLKWEETVETIYLKRSKHKENTADVFDIKVLTKT